MLENRTMSSFCVSTFSLGTRISAISKGEDLVEVVDSNAHVLQKIPMKGELFVVWSANSLHFAIVSRNSLNVTVYAEISQESQIPSWTAIKQIKIEEPLEVDQVSFSYPHILLNRNKECVLVNIVNLITQIIPIPVSLDVDAEEPSGFQIQKQLEAINCSAFLNKLSYSGRYISTFQNSPSVPMGKIIRIYDTVDVLTATLDKSVPAVSMISLANVDDDHFDFKFVDINLEKSNPAVSIKWRPTSQTHLTINNTSNSNNSNVLGDSFSHTEHFLLQQLNGDTKIYSVHTDTMPDDDGIVAQALSAAVAAGVVNANENEFLNNHSTADNYILKITESAPIVRLLIELPYSFLYSNVSNPVKKLDESAFAVDEVDGLMESSSEVGELKPVTLDVHIDWVVHALQSSVEFNLRNATAAVSTGASADVKPSSPGESGNALTRGAKTQDADTFRSAWLTIVLPVHPTAAVWEEQGLRKRYNNVNKVLEYHSVPKSKTLRSRSRSFSTASSNSLSSGNVTHYEGAQCSLYAVNLFYLRHDPKSGNFSAKLCNEGYSCSIDGSEICHSLSRVHTVAKFPANGLGFPLSVVTNMSLVSSTEGVMINTIQSAVQLMHSSNYLKISPQWSENVIAHLSCNSNSGAVVVVPQVETIPREVKFLPLTGQGLCQLTKSYAKPAKLNSVSRCEYVDLFGAIRLKSPQASEDKIRVIRAVRLTLCSKSQNHLVSASPALTYSDTDCLVVLYARKSLGTEDHCLGLWTKNHHDHSTSVVNQLQSHYHSPSLVNTPMQTERKSGLQRQTSKGVSAQTLPVPTVYTVELVPDSHFGLGLRLDVHPVNNKSILVNSFKRHPLSNEPMAAEQKGLITPGDEIVKINEQTLYGHTLPEVIAIIKGVLSGCGPNQIITLTMRKLSEAVGSSGMTESKGPIVAGTPEKDKAEKAMRTHKSNVVHIADYFCPVSEIVLTNTVAADLIFMNDSLWLYSVDQSQDICELRNRIVTVRLSNKILGLVKMRLAEDYPTSVPINRVSGLCRLQLWHGSTRQSPDASVMCSEATGLLVQLIKANRDIRRIVVKNCEFMRTEISSTSFLSNPFTSSLTYLRGQNSSYSLSIDAGSAEKSSLSIDYQGSLATIDEKTLVAGSVEFAVSAFSAVKSQYDAMMDTTTSMNSVSKHELVRQVTSSAAAESFNAAEELLNPIHPLEILIDLFDPLHELTSQSPSVVLSPRQLSKAIAGLLAMVDDSTDSLNGDARNMSLTSHEQGDSELARLSSFLRRKLQPYVDGSQSSTEPVVNCNGVTLTPYLTTLLYTTSQMVLTLIKLSSEVTGGDDSVVMDHSEEAELNFEVRTVYKFLAKLNLDYYGVKAVLQMLFQRVLNDFVGGVQAVVSSSGTIGKSSRSATVSVVSDTSSTSQKYSQPIKLSGMGNNELTDALTAKYEFLGETLKDITGHSTSAAGSSERDDKIGGESKQDVFRVSGTTAASLFFSASQSQLFKILIESAHEDVKSVEITMEKEDKKSGAEVLGKYLTEVYEADGDTVKANQTNERRNRNDFNFAGLAMSTNEAGDVLKYLSECLVGFWLHDCNVLCEFIQKQTMKQFKAHKSSIQIFLEMVVIGRIDTLLMLAKTDREKSGKQLLSILNVYSEVDAESDEDEIAQCNKVLKKNAFALLRLQRYKDAAAVFLMARPPFIKEACSVLNNQYGNPLLALLVTRLVETRVRFTSTLKPSSTMLGPIARRLLAHDVMPALIERLDSLQIQQAVTHAGGSDAPLAAFYSELTGADARMLILVCSYWLQNKSILTQAFQKAVTTHSSGIDSGMAQLASKMQALKTAGIDVSQLYEVVSVVSGLSWQLESGYFVGPSAYSSVIQSYQTLLTKNHLHHHVLELSCLGSEKVKLKFPQIMTKNGYNIACLALKEKVKNFVPETVSNKSTAPVTAAQFVEAPVEPSVGSASVIQSTPMKASLFNFSSSSKAPAATSSRRVDAAASGTLNMLDEFSPQPVRRVPSGGQQTAPVNALDMFDTIPQRSVSKPTATPSSVEPRSALDMFDAPARPSRTVPAVSEPRSALDMFDIPSRPSRNLKDDDLKDEPKNALDAFDIPQRSTKPTPVVEKKADPEPRSALDMFDVPSRPLRATAVSSEGRTDQKNTVKSALDSFDIPAAHPVKPSVSGVSKIGEGEVSSVASKSALDMLESIPSRANTRGPPPGNPLVHSNSYTHPMGDTAKHKDLKGTLDFLDKLPKVGGSSQSRDVKKPDGGHAVTHPSVEKQKPLNPFLKNNVKAKGDGVSSTVPTKPKFADLTRATQSNSSAAESAPTEPNTSSTDDSDLITAISKELDVMDLK